MILEGTVGEVKYQNATGSGAYQFKTKTGWTQPVACLDTTRLRLGSKGLSWDNGWAKGYDIGKAEYDTWPKPAFNDTPYGTGAGGTLYDEGYKLGYARGWDGLSTYNAEYQCPGTGMDAATLARYDSDGWYKYTGADHMDGYGITSVSMPPSTYVLSPSKDHKDSLLGTGYSFTFKDVAYPIHEGTSNSTSVVNLRRFDVNEGALEAEDLAIGTIEDWAQAYYDAQKAALATKYGPTCAYTDPTIETKSYGSNSFTTLSYVLVCSAGGSAEQNWNQLAFGFMRNSAGTRQLSTAFYNPSTIKKSGVNEYNTDAFINTDFINDLFTKIVY